MLLLMTSFGEVRSLMAEQLRVEDSAKPSTPGLSASSGSKRNDLDSMVVYTARDSLIYNTGNRSADLFGKAKVEYKDIRIEGPRITLDQTTTTASTSATRHPDGRLSEVPVFTDSAGSFLAETMDYNYKSRIGRASGLSSKNELGILSGREITRLPTGEMLVEDGIYTTCDLDEPHYWFEGRKMRIIPGERLISRPFIMYIHPELFSWRLPVIPLLPLPYMSLSLSNKRASGFLFPRFGQSASRGVSFSNLGYFWAISDYADLRMESDLSFNGSWRLGERFRYKKGDRYSGSLEGEYEKIQLYKPGDPDYARYVNRNYRLIHHQMFDPVTSLDVNFQYIGGNRYYSTGAVDPESVITQQATSYASFSRSWDEGNRVLTGGYQRVENLVSGDLTQVVTTSLYQNRIYPFRQDPGGVGQEWRSRFSMQPSLSASGQFVDSGNSSSDLYTGNAGVDFNYNQEFAPGYRAQFSQGANLQVQHQLANLSDDLGAVRLQLPFKVHTTLFRYLNLTPSITYTRYQVGSTISKRYDNISDTVATQIVHEQDQYETVVFALEAQTRVYGTLNTGMLENLFGLNAVRHTLVPSVTLTCNPDYRGSGYHYYDTCYDPVSQSMVRYNRFEQSLYPDVPEQRTTVGISLQNLFHGRFRSDEVMSGGGYRSVQLFALNASSGYNFAADSLRASPLVLTASSNAFSPALMFSAGGTYDFYSFDPATGSRIDKLALDDGKGLLRYVSGFLNMSVSFSGNLRSPYVPTESGGDGSSVLRQVASPVEQAIYRDRFNSDDMVQFSEALPWSWRLSLYLASDKSNPLEPTNTRLLNSAAKVSLSRNWQAGLNTGFDLDNSKFIYPALMVYRDLHDFQFSFQWVPSGQYEGYFVQIGLKPAHLRFLKVRASSGNSIQ